jgi:hypothetical protein
LYLYSTCHRLVPYGADPDRLEVWVKGSVGLGKALYLGSQNKIDEAIRLVDEIEAKYGNERRVTQYIENIRRYIASAASNGKAAPLGKVAKEQAKPM